MSQLVSLRERRHKTKGLRQMPQPLSCFLGTFLMSKRPSLDTPPEHEPSEAEAEASVRVRTFEVAINYDGWRLDRYLEQKIGRLTRSQIKRAIRAGTVSVDPCLRLEPNRKKRTKPKPGLCVRDGDLVRVRKTMRPETLQDAEVSLLAETPRFLAFDKPAGMLMHPTANEFRNTLLAYIDRQCDQGKPWQGAEVIHRLDRETSGVVLMARTPDAQRDFCARFEHNEIKKLYLAVVQDPAHLHPLHQDGESTQPLGFETQTRLPGIKIGKGSWPAKTRWRCVRRHNHFAALAVAIEGGRQHQIRVHLSLFGTPILGDKLYAHGEDFFLAYLDGDADLSPLLAPRQTLHAWQIAFNDNSLQYIIRAPVPALFSDLLQDHSPWEIPEFFF
jgi:RluA family pseudouridine synthase